MAIHRQKIKKRELSSYGFKTVSKSRLKRAKDEPCSRTKETTKVLLQNKISGVPMVDNPGRFISDFNISRDLFSS